jgi:NAD(P)-dependent dehydrogenase (short-subunit alcohol dehydrogenase family)
MTAPNPSATSTVGPFRPPVVPAASALLLLAALLSGCSGEGVEGPSSPAPVVLVTGSTDGLGRELALELAATGAHVIVHGRNEERGREVVETIEAEGIGAARFYAADFASLEEVRGLARAVRRDYERLDVLVNNAGVGPGAPGHERVLTEDGNELRLQVNYLAGYLLTRELLPLLMEAAPARIVNVASRAQQPLDFDDLRMDQRYSGGLAYSRSKLAQILFTLDLAQELRDTGVRVYAVHPAPAMDTGLVRETGLRAQTPVSRGVEAVFRVIVGEGLESGTYFHELEPGQPHPQADDLDARRRLRALSEALVHAADGGAPEA